MVKGRLLFAAGLVAAGVLAAASPAGAANNGHARPMAGVCSTTFSVSNEGVISITGTCLMTHLGRATYQATQTIVPNPDGTVHITITGFYTAANGDILRSTLVGTGRFASNGGVTYTTTETFSGGTGRFSDATGTASDLGVASFTGPTTGTSTFVSVGSISF
jgi:hypothetical protein